MTTRGERFEEGCRAALRDGDRLEVAAAPQHLVRVTVRTPQRSADELVPELQIEEAIYPADLGRAVVARCYAGIAGVG